MDIERKRSVVINVFYFGFILAFLVAMVKYALPMLAPFVLAVLIAYILRRPTRWICKRISAPERPVAILLVLVFVVEPKIVGSQLGLHPVVTLASMFAGVQLFGVVGLFGFPIGLSLLRYLNDNGSIHIIK